MNNQQWSKSNSATDMLAGLNEEKRDCYKVELQLFFIDCCRLYLYLLPHEEFRVALDLAEDYASDQISLDKVREYNWYTESAVFSMDYDIDTEKNLAIYENIQEKLSLQNILDARAFAISLGYFVDWTSMYLSDFAGKTNDEYERFLDADLLRRRIREPF